MVLKVKSIKSFEENLIWYSKVKKLVPLNVNLIYADDSDKSLFLDFIKENLKNGFFMILLL